MRTICEYGIAAGEWIARHTLEAYPVETTLVLCVVCLLEVAVVAGVIRQERRTR